MHKRITLSEAKRLDEKLLSLAGYDVTGGMIPLIKSAEEMKEFQVKVFNRFNKFKKWVQYGEFTIAQLENDVVTRNAAVNQMKGSDSEDDDLSKDEAMKTGDESAFLLLAKLLGGSNEDIDKFDALLKTPLSYDRDLYNDTKESPSKPEDGKEESNEEEDDGITLE